jgi:hypothetical protein
VKAQGFAEVNRNVWGMDASSLMILS